MPVAVNAEQCFAILSVTNPQNQTTNYNFVMMDYLTMNMNTSRAVFETLGINRLQVTITKWNRVS